MGRTNVIGLTAVVAFALVLVSCVPPTPTPPAGLQITLAEFAIDSPQTNFTVETPVHFVITNAGSVPHEFVITPRMMGGMPMDMKAMHRMALLAIEEDELPAGATVEADFTFNRAGEYEFACHLPGHYEAGMVLPIVVQ